MKTFKELLQLKSSSSNSSEAFVLMLYGINHSDLKKNKGKN